MPRMSARATAVFLAGIFALWIALPRLRPATDDATAVREAEARLSLASAKGDVPALGKIVANDFFAVDVNGKRETRQSLLDRYRTSPWKVLSFRQESLEVHLYGETAVVTGVDRVQARNASGKEHAGAYRFLHVFQKRHDRWWLISGQLAAVPTP
jgi:ketosteroid isomerase-like protein